MVCARAFRSQFFFRLFVMMNMHATVACRNNVAGAVIDRRITTVKVPGDGNTDRGR